MRSSTAVRCLILARVPLLPAKTAVFWQEGFPIVASQPVKRDALVEALADADTTVTALARIGLLVLPYSSSVRPPAHERAKDVQSWDDRIAVPDLQRLTVSDRVYVSRIAYLVIYSMTPYKFLTWVGDDPPHGAFTFGLFPVDEKHTRLVIRARLRYHWTDSRILLDLFTEFGDHVAVPRMLLGIRDRVEGHRIQSLAVQAAEITVWIAFLLEFVVAIVLVFVRRQWRRTWTTALLAASGLLFALYAREPVWTGALLQVPILASMVWARGANSRNVA